MAYGFENSMVFSSDFVFLVGSVMVFVRDLWWFRVFGATRCNEQVVSLLHIRSLKTFLLGCSTSSVKNARN
ncbi:hypothetical protein ACE6H2_027111 [Prunus campanulata]